MIYEKQPDNPFYYYLRHGANDTAKQKLLETCGKIISDSGYSSNAIGQGKEWSWESLTSEAKWENTMGWDCVFLANLLGIQEP